MTIQILIVDDEQPIRESLSGLFEDEGYLVSTAPSGEEAVARFRKSPADCVFLDIWMPGIDGLETMSRIKQIDADVPIIMMSGHATIDTAVRATRLGAFDFIEKPFSLDKLLILLRNAVEKRRLELENSDLRFEKNIGCPQLIGNSKAISQVRKNLEKIKTSDVPVLFVGEHGTGKSVAAQILHKNSSRSGAPFVPFHATESGDMVEAELFGYEKGAFVKALQAQRGRLEAAHSGSIFFEEIADVPLETQKNILRVMQEHRLQRLGNRTKVACDVRLLMATQHQKVDLIQNQRLLKELCTRLNLVTIEMPTLQQRAEDIPMLLESLVQEQSSHLGVEPIAFDEEVMDMLKTYAWPGNVSELRNYVERCHMLCAGQTLTSLTMLPLSATMQQQSTYASVPDDSVLLAGFHDARKRFERSYILHHLDKNEWNISKTAADIGMERSQLHRKIKAHDLSHSSK